MAEKIRKPDWTTWLHVQRVDLWECVLLSLDIEPTDHEYDADHLEYDAKVSIDWDADTWGNVAKRLLVARRNVCEGGRLQDSLYPGTADTQVSLGDFVIWAKSVGWDVPAQLAQLVNEVAQPVQAGRWPWGDYNTKLLSIMDAVARKWWVNYDPSDPTSAKTKDVIVSAIIADHGCTKNQAEAIYTVLRADDLPRGPRS